MNNHQTREVDKCKGVINDIRGKSVYVSLYPNGTDDVYTLELKRKYFIQEGVRVKPDEGFYFWIEKTGPKEVVRLRPIPTRELTSKDLEEITLRAKELLDGDF